MKNIVIGTRGSLLARKQSEIVGMKLREAWPGLETEEKIIKTTGDKILDVPLSKIGGKGLFTKELETALLDRAIDLAVHSMKDLPTAFPEGLALGAVLRRDMPNDVVISRYGVPFTSLPEGCRVGTSSLRRIAQLKAARPDVVFQDLRGNLDTRIRKIDEGVVDAVVVSGAGPQRLERLDVKMFPIEMEICLPAVSQGVIGVEAREGDSEIFQALQPLNHRETRICVTAERALMARMEGGCQVPIGAHAFLEGETLLMSGCVASLDGRTVLRESIEGPSAEAESLGRRLGERLLDRGGGRIIEAIRPPG